MPAVLTPAAGVHAPAGGAVAASAGAADRMAGLAELPGGGGGGGDDPDGASAGGAMGGATQEAPARDIYFATEIYTHLFELPDLTARLASSKAVNGLVVDVCCYTEAPSS
jgi:hypothetical protein